MARVLVTGAAGFLGSAACRLAASRGDSVLAVVREGELRAGVPGVEYETIDWLNPTALASSIARHLPDAVIHCAGATPRAVQDVVGIYEANVAPTWRLLSAVQSSCVDPMVVVVSSAAVYGSTPPVPVTEEAPRLPVDHYGWSKGLAEDLVRAFVGVGSLRACIARPFNLLGRGEPAGSVVSDVVAQLAEDPDRGVVRVRRVKPVRDFVAVRDAAAALLLLGERADSGGTYNVASGSGTSVLEVVRLILEVWGSSAVIESLDEEDAGPDVSIGEAGRLVSLGWKPSTTIREAIRELQRSVTAGRGPVRSTSDS
ncbi:MAG: NAD(P)-dependent oxidoreductase [Coriobacteriia bacterium]|nr:NAD(P)-dependent oxidoreductase [Coriobacteriia bacterium]